MKKRIGTMLLTFAVLVRLFAEVPEPAWQESFERAFSAALESRAARVPQSIVSRYRLISASRIVPSGDPDAAGTAAALLMLRYEKDIRSGIDLQEAGARLGQAVSMMGRTDSPETVLRKLEMVRKGARTDGRRMSGIGGQSADEAGRDMRVREKGK